MEFESAVAGYTKALELCGDLTRAAELQNGRGSAYSRLGDYAHAIADYDLALELGPDPHMAAVLHTNRGYAFARTQDHERAVDDFQLAIKQDAGYAPAHYHLACAFAHLGNPTAAFDSLERAIELDGAFRGMACSEAELQSMIGKRGFPGSPNDGLEDLPAESGVAVRGGRSDRPS
jgi:tetratricopeptide (TPR) repeat protein